MRMDSAALKVSVVTATEPLVERLKDATISFVPAGVVEELYSQFSPENDAD